MNNVYISSIYNVFLKQERKKRKIKLQDLSKQIHYSLGVISQLENSTDLLANGKTSVLLLFYGYDIEYLINFNNTLNKLFKKYFESVLTINDLEVKNSYNELCTFFSSYKDTVLYNAFYFCKFVYNLYFYDYSKATKYFSLLNEPNYYTEEYNALYNIYLARYYIHIMNYELALEHLKLPIYTHIQNLDIQGFYNISLSAVYMHNKDLGKAIKHCDEAITCFTNTNNYRRLLNTNIDKGNQLLKIKDYKSAILFNNQILKTAIELNYHSEIRALLNNNGFIYMMQNKYDKASTCFEAIPKEEMKEEHYCSYVICLVEIGNYNKASSLTSYWIKNASNPYFHRLFNIFNDYLLSNDLLKLNKDLIKLLKTFYTSIDMFEIEFLHVLIAHHYNKLKMYKYQADYLERLRALDYYEQ